MLYKEPLQPTMLGRFVTNLCFSVRPLSLVALEWEPLLLYHLALLSLIHCNYEGIIFYICLFAVLLHL